jgi:hypothetical protein
VVKATEVKVRIILVRAIVRTVGQLSPTLMQQINECLKASLEIP